jgi:outer membrane protein assembly factor BamB
MPPLPRIRLALACALCAALLVPAAAAAAAPHFGYDVPVPQDSPWPSMRHDSRNTGRSPLPGVYRGDRPWAFHTGKGIFSTPVIGGDGTVYVGSADTFFYAIGPDGKLRWKLRTGNIIDSAAVLGARDRRTRAPTLTFGSADETLYRLTTKRPRGRLKRPPRVLWRFHPTQPPVKGQQVNWWEGNADIGPGGTVYAGNTGGYEYAVDPSGKQKWAFAAGNSIWTEPAFAKDGTTYVGSLDLYVYALDQGGKQVWRTPTIGFVISSPALGSDGTVYVGSFDSKLYALDGQTGVPKWSFSTGDHIYSSPAVQDDAQGRTEAIYFASTDGNVYAVDPSGNLLWRYDTGDVVRSSPVLGPTPDGRGETVYVGAGNGRLFALDAATGRRRWSYDTTSTDPILRDRNDLNASPALGTTGVYIGGEDGSVDYVPYDYCLHHPDPRCDTSPGQGFADDLTRVFPVSSGGNLQQQGYAQALPDSTTLVSRLVVRKGGTTADAQMQPVPSTKSLVTADPPFDFSAELSGDGHYVFVVPNDFLAPSTSYALHVGGTYTSGGLRVGPQTIGATGAAPFADTIRFRTAPLGGRLPLSAPTRRRDSAFRLLRLAAPLPPFLPSVNQIGFDSYDLIAGTLAKSPPGPNGEGTFLLWLQGGRRDAKGRLVADPKAPLAFPIAGRYRGDEFILSGQNLELTFSFGDVPLQRFDMRGRMGADRRVKPGAALYAEALCATVPNYGPELAVATRLCNAEGKLVASGTFVTQPYTTKPAPRARPGAAGPANVRPRGVRVASLVLKRPTESQDGSATVRLALARKVRYPASAHALNILLTDAATGAVVPLTYRKSTTVAKTARGDIATATLTIPAGTSMPASVRAYVVADVYPLLVKVL